MNILILSCGTRNKLLSFFKQSPYWDRVIATDCSELAPALSEADAFYLVPRFKDPNYFEKIIEICKSEKVNAILPLQEEELLLISKNRDYFVSQGIFPIISEYEKVALCKDKYQMYQFLVEHDIPTIPTFLPEQLSSDDVSKNAWFLKPRYGAGSVHSMSVKTEAFLRAYLGEAEEEMIIQPLVSGTEFGVDAYVDFHSHKLVSIFCKEKLRMRAGETEKSISVMNASITKLVKKVIDELKPSGPVDMDIFESNGEYRVLEVNPRFGGGYPHAHLCGIHFPDFIGLNVMGKENDDHFRYEEGVLGLKYSDIIVRKAKEG